MKGKGCGTCNNTGYKGRVAALRSALTDGLKELVLQGGRAQDRDDPRRHAEPTGSPESRRFSRASPHRKRSCVRRSMTRIEMAPPYLRRCSRRCSTRGIGSPSAPRHRRVCASTTSSVRLQTDPLTPVDTKTLCYSVMNDAQKLRFEEDLEIGFSFGIRGVRTSTPCSRWWSAARSVSCRIRSSRSRISAYRRWSPS